MLKFKKTLAILLSVIMTLSVAALPLSVGAAEVQTEPVGLNYNGFEYWVDDTDEGKLVYVYNYNGPEKDIVIPSEIDGMPVRKIDYYQEYAPFCNYATSIVIPDSVTSIEQEAFKNSYSLKSITIGRNVDYIGDRFFAGCNNLSEITILGDHTRVNKKAFLNTAYYNDLRNWKKGALYISDHLIDVDTTLSGKYVIKDGTKTIADYAFDGCKGLTEIVIPNNLTIIGMRAFNGCVGVTEFIIPDTVTYIGSSAFYNCEKLSYVKLSNRLKKLELGTFYNCLNLKSIVIPDNVIDVGESVFSGCKNLSTVILPKNITIIRYHTFYGCNSLYTVDIPNKVEVIDKWAFYSCKNLKSIVLPDSVKSILVGAFQGCSNLESITIPKTTTEIWHDVFDGCKSLTIYGYEGSYAQSYAKSNKINFLVIGESEPNFVFSELNNGDLEISKYIGNEPNVKLPNTYNNSKVTSIGDSAFENCLTIKSVTIPDSIKTINSKVFDGCLNLTDISIPDNVDYIKSDAFDNCGYYNNADNWVDDVLYLDGYLIKASPEISGSCSIKDTTKTIVNSAFSGCKDLVSVTIPDSVTTLQENIFSDCSSLTEVSFGKNNKYIPSYTFNNCNGLKNVVIPETVNEIKAYAFNNCKNLTEITITENVITIDINSFSGCSNLTIYGYEYTVAESFAIKYDYKFVDINSIKYDLGDIDLDGQITVLDVTLLQRYCAEDVILNTEQLSVSDVDGNGDISILDVTAIQKLIAG